MNCLASFIDLAADLDANAAMNQYARKDLNKIIFEILMLNTFQRRMLANQLLITVSTYVPNLEHIKSSVQFKQQGTRLIEFGMFITLMNWKSQ